MAKLVETVKKALEEDDWHPQQDVVEGLDRVHTRYTAEEGSWNFVVLIDEEDMIATFYSVLDTPCPEERRRDLAELLTRLNYGMRIGKFELDFSDGDLRYQSGHLVQNSKLTPEIIIRHAYNNVLTMEKHFTAIMKVMFSEKSTKETLEGIMEEDDGEEKAEFAEYIPTKDSSTNLYIH